MLTNWIESGFEHPLPRELLLEVHLNTDSVDAALEQARTLASAVVPAAAFAGNGWIGDVEPHLVYETTPDVSEREFVEYFAPDERGLVSPTREVDPALISAVAAAVLRSAYWAVISTALAHYYAGLRHYYLGGEALAVEHIFMAAEALRKTTLEQYCRASGRSEKEIMAAEGHENRDHLLAWVRREIIFAGDRAVHAAAKAASDGMEHGFRTVGEVRALAEPVCDTAFAHVRRAIADLLDVAPEIRSELLGRFGKPADTQSLRRRVIGSLVGDGNELAAPGSDHPVLAWSSGVARFDIDDSGMPRAQFRDRFTVRTAEGIGFQLRRMEVYGRRDPDARPEHAEMRVETPPQTRARDRVMPALRKLDRAVEACGPGEAGASYPQPVAHLLRMFSRAKSLFRGCTSLLEKGLPEEALVLGRQLFRDAMRLHEAAEATEEQRFALAFGWVRDSVAAARDMVVQFPDGSVRDEYERRAEEQDVAIHDAAQRFGVSELRSFAGATETASTLSENDLAHLDRLAECMEGGWVLASSSRHRTREEGSFELHDTAPDSWVYPLAASYIGGSYLIAGQASLRLFGWDDPEGQLAEAGSALKELETEASETQLGGAG